MSNIIQGIFGNVSANHLIRRAHCDIPHNEGDRLYTNGRAVVWASEKPRGWSRFGNLVPVRPEPPCAA